MNDGRIEQVGTPTDLYDAPRTRFVASFIGESNFLDGRVATLDGDRCRVECPDIGSLAAASRDGLRVHHEVSVTVRPEKIVLGETPETMDSTMNRLTGIVEQVIFVGETRRYEIALAGGARMIVKRQNRSGVPGYERGDRVQIAWHIEDTKLV